MKNQATTLLAAIGAGLFTNGLAMIYTPAAWLFLGAATMWVAIRAAARNNAAAAAKQG